MFKKSGEENGMQIFFHQERPRSHTMLEIHIFFFIIIFFNFFLIFYGRYISIRLRQNGAMGLNIFKKHNHPKNKKFRNFFFHQSKRRNSVRLSEQS